VTFGRRHAPRTSARGFGPRSLVRAWLGGPIDFVGKAVRDGFVGARELGRLLRALPRREAAAAAVVVTAAGAVPFLSVLAALDVFRATPVLQHMLEQPLLLCGGAAALSLLGVLAIERPRGSSPRAWVQQLATRLHSLRANSGAATRRSTDEGAVP
jgi:hypothetical protein